MSTESPAIAITGLRKHFGATVAVDGIDLEVPAGSIYGFLGPNGSGKTTTIRMLLGLVFADAGEMRVLDAGMPGGEKQVLPDVGALIEAPAFYPFLSGRANLERFDAVGIGAQRHDRTARVEAALARVDLVDAAGRKFKTYSLGMKQRLALAAVLLAPRRLIILDEPTNGLDPQGTREIRTLIRDLAADGTTVFLSSHLLAEVEQICTHAAVLRDGRVVADGTIASLRSERRVMLHVETPDTEAAVRVLGEIEGLGEIEVDHDQVWAPLRGAAPEDCTAALVHAGVRVRTLTTDVPSLEDAFMELTGDGAHADE